MSVTTPQPLSVNNAVGNSALVNVNLVQSSETEFKVVDAVVKSVKLYSVRFRVHWLRVNAAAEINIHISKAGPFAQQKINPPSMLCYTPPAIGIFD